MERIWSTATMKRILSRYLISEILPPFALGLVALTAIVVMARVVKLIELVVARGVPLGDMLELFLLILPTFLEITLPSAVLLGIFLGLGRLAADHEILALKASGVGPTQILLPVGVLAVIVTFAALAMTTSLRPQANLALKRKLYQIARSHIGSALREKIFIDEFPRALVYMEEVDPTGLTSQGILIVDKSRPARENIIFGKAALILADEEAKTLGLRIIDGAAYERDPKSPSFSRFSTYELTLDLGEALNPVPKKEREAKEMSLRRLLKTIDLKRSQGIRPTEELIELHLRWAFSFLPLILSPLGVCAVLLPRRLRTGRFSGLTFCLSCLFLYYGLLSVGKALAEKELVPAALGLWLPNLTLGLIAAELFRRALKESPLPAQKGIGDLAVLRRLKHPKRT